MEGIERIGPPIVSYWSSVTVALEVERALCPGVDPPDVTLRRRPGCSGVGRNKRKKRLPGYRRIWRFKI
jgi:hypothetical protein